MRTTINVDDNLMRKAQRQTGLKSKTEVLELALRVLLEREARRKLKALYGTAPRLQEVRRRHA